MMARTSAAVMTMGVLAALDLIGALVARRYAEQRSLIVLALGAATFAALFVVYAHGLRYADLTTVTFGWVALLQIGVVVLDRSGGQGVPPIKVMAMVGIVALEGVLLMSPSG